VQEKFAPDNLEQKFMYKKFESKSKSKRNSRALKISPLYKEQFSMISPENAVRASYLILAAGAAAGCGKNPTARHLTSRPAAPAIGVAPPAAVEVVVDRL